MMTIRKRYFLTSAIIITALVGAFFTAKFVRGASSSQNLQNLKVKGPENAPIHVVVYSDFQCPACQKALEPLDELGSQFSGEMQIEFRHFPLVQAHRWALAAASFAECAAQQGKFWEFHDRLYAEQTTWAKSEDALIFFADYAQELNLDKKILEACLENPKTAAQIQRERSTGEKRKVESTPTIFINGRPVVGGLQLRLNGKTIVLEELKKLGIKTEDSQS